MTLDLGPSCEELLGNMKSKTRYNIRYAQRKEVVVTRVKEKALMDEFYKLLEETAQRDRFTIRSSSYFYTLWDELMENKLAPFVSGQTRRRASGRSHPLYSEQSRVVCLWRIQQQ